MTPEQIKRLDGIKDGKRVSVSFCQQGNTVAFIAGRWVGRDPPEMLAWEVRSTSVNGRGFIVPTDKVSIFGARSVSGVRVDLSGRRIAMSRDNVALLRTGLVDNKACKPGSAMEESAR